LIDCLICLLYLYVRLAQLSAGGVCHFSGDNILIVVSNLALNIIRYLQLLELIGVIISEPWFDQPIGIG